MKGRTTEGKEGEGEGKARVREGKGGEGTRIENEEGTKVKQITVNW